MRGGERILESLCRLFPSATIFTLLHLPGSVSHQIESHPIRTSFIQRLPFTREHYRRYLPLFPRAIEAFDLSGFDLVISISHCVAKGIIPPEGAVSVCICLTPVRYSWDQMDTYFPESSPQNKLLIRPLLKRLRDWDRRTADRVHHYIAISDFVADRIRRYYDRDSEVIYPPVDMSRFAIAPVGSDDFYLIVSAFAPYKRLDIAIEAFKCLDAKLKIIGKGQDERRLREMAPPNVEFLGPVSDEVVADHLALCKALLFCGVEDFGIVPLEALASGRPVIAFGQGGVLETLEDGRTGVFFSEQTPASLISAIERAETIDFYPDTLRKAAARFDIPVFERRFREFIADRVGIR
ncbi:MAG: glycosyltransferase [Candidatus Coatesbacteria bacterium]|nr:glycosyltransferase [Candidatus Coatesbacteria bacterium]